MSEQNDDLNYGDQLTELKEKLNYIREAVVNHASPDQNQIDRVDELINELNKNPIIDLSKKVNLLEKKFNEISKQISVIDDVLDNSNIK